ncbi:hypothetical protein SLEP1_g4967 [Rubroshorea leprosula]|uniref:Uncharacterized protein n=1 Tax=Rubroshorea leprosula TaxID=152421 RepID=A0AAV5I073_9ROSI|nr:hypothetical protein SLEP1_g4967 [Rubroshorea leprosula]
MLGFGFFGFQLWKLGKLVIQHQSSSLEGLLHDYALNRTVLQVSGAGNGSQAATRRELLL